MVPRGIHNIFSHRLILSSPTFMQTKIMPYNKQLAQPPDELMSLFHPSKFLFCADGLIPRWKLSLVELTSNGFNYRDEPMSVFRPSEVLFCADGLIRWWKLSLVELMPIWLYPLTFKGEVSTLEFESMKTLNRLVVNPGISL